jgi:translation initiation factor 2B subunit (eIF-2B alpha/beta/delta family)
MEEKNFGSYRLCEHYLSQLTGQIHNSKISQPDALVESISRIGREYIKEQPNMIAIRKRITTIVYYLKRLSKGGKSVDQIKQLALDKIKEIQTETRNKVEKIGEIGSRLILSQSKVVTFGYSTNVLNIFTRAQKLKRKFSVYCLEGRPAFNGRQMSEEIARKGIPVHLLTDAGMAWAMSEVNMVLIGADRVFETGITTQTGGLPLAVIAGHFKVPVYVACELEKIMTELDLAVRYYQQNKEAILPKSKKQLSAINFNFETVPLEFLSKFVCEEGVFDLNEYTSWFLKD